MTVRDLLAWIENQPLDMPVLIKHFGNEDKEEDATFEDVANIEVEQVKGKDTLTIAGY